MVIASQQDLWLQRLVIARVEENLHQVAVQRDLGGG